MCGEGYEGRWGKGEWRKVVGEEREKWRKEGLI